MAHVGTIQGVLVLSPAVRVQNVVKRIWDGRERRIVVDDVSFDIERGEFVVLRGPSGSGKTTLLAIVGAMLSPTSGEIYLDGEPTSRLREAHRAEIRRRKVGFVFQDLQLVDGLSARDNVLLPRVPDGIRRADEQRADELLDRFGLREIAGTRARSLSGGERQRVALARALINNPALLVLDEPTAHLDDAHAVSIASDLATIARDGRAVLVATHDARVASSEGVRRILDLAAGKLVPRHDAMTTSEP
ncbi:MAG: ABC transporter ATP-binding protein [Polyangiaceae bacterium]|nr:ABC transporter ATP-binding protein [Polyangiaceae bacterium]